MDRKTVELGSSCPELLAFTTDEAALCVRAVSYYATSSLRTLEANWDREGLVGITMSAEEATGEIDFVVDFVGFYQGLARKFAEAIVEPDEAVELSAEEISRLGESLFRLGNSGLTGALATLAAGTVRFGSEEATEQVKADAHHTAGAAYDLFKKVEPIARTKRHCMWPVWDQAPAEYDSKS